MSGEPAVTDTVGKSVSAACLNCGTVLSGPFCSQCGQRAIGAYPTVREMIGDVWQELWGWDGRLVRTVRLLLRRPGALTVEVMEGRRARYVSPVRLYLLASVVYFLCAASVPTVRTPDPAPQPGQKSGVVRLNPSGRPTGLTAAQRAEALKDLERRPWWLQAVLRPIVEDPEGYRLRYLQALPRVLFVLVPVFACIVSLFCWHRPFPQHLIFAVHLHTAIFAFLTVGELSQLTRSPIIVDLIELGVTVGIVVYGCTAFRRVYRESWWRVFPKAVGIAFIYGIVGVIALLATMIIAARLP